MGNAIGLQTLHSHPELVKSMKTPIVARHILALCPGLVELCLETRAGEGNLIGRSFSTQSKEYFAKAWFLDLQKRPSDMRRLLPSDYTKVSWETLNVDQFVEELIIALEPTDGSLAKIDAIDSQITEAINEQDRNLIRFFNKLPWWIRGGYEIIPSPITRRLNHQADQIRERLTRMKLEDGVTGMISDVRTIVVRGLTELPRETELFTNCRDLVIERGSLKRIPDLNLPNLVSLQVTGNQLTSIPNFTHLTNLESLYVIGNKLRTLPKLDRCRNLWVYFQYNPLENLPTEFWEQIPFSTQPRNDCIAILKEMNASQDFRYTEEFHHHGFLLNQREGRDLFGQVFLKYNQHLQQEHEAGRLDDPQYINPHAEKACNTRITHPEVLMAALITTK